MQHLWERAQVEGRRVVLPQDQQWPKKYAFSFKRFSFLSFQFILTCFQRSEVRGPMILQVFECGFKVNLNLKNQPFILIPLTESRTKARVYSVFLW